MVISNMYFSYLLPILVIAQNRFNPINLSRSIFDPSNNYNSFPGSPFFAF